MAVSTMNAGLWVMSSVATPIGTATSSESPMARACPPRRAPVERVAQVAARDDAADAAHDPDGAMNTLPRRRARSRSSMISHCDQTISALAPNVARMPPASAMQIRRGQQVSARGQLVGPAAAARARPRTPRAPPSRIDGAAGDPEHVAPADLRRQHVAEHEAAGRPERHADVVDAERATALFGRRRRAQQRVGAGAVGALADADHRAEDQQHPERLRHRRADRRDAPDQRRRRRSPCAGRCGRRSGPRSTTRARTPSG